MRLRILEIPYALGHVPAKQHAYPVNELRFRLRQNWDGTLDSICLKCFLTVAHGRDESARALLEHCHVCDPLHLARFRAPGDAANARENN
jgi:hypothetical protein